MKRLFIIVLSILLLFSSIVVATTLIIRSNTDDSNIFISLGNFFLRNNNEAAALAVYEKGLELSPDNTGILNNLGYYYKDKNPLLAEDYFLKALSLDPEYDTARNNLALLYHSVENYGEAVKHLRILVEKNPDNIQYNYDLAVNLGLKYRFGGNDYNDLNEALNYFAIVYEMEPNYEHALDNIRVLNEIKNMLGGT